MIVREATRLEYPWIVQRTGCAPTAQFRALVVITDDHRIVGMVGFDLWTKRGAWMHVAIETPAALPLLVPAAFQYLFVDNKYEIAFATIPAGNTRSVNFAKKAGFRETYRVKDGWDLGEDLVFLELHKAECRWIGRRAA